MRTSQTLFAAAAAAALAIGATPARAHPHVWVNVETTVVYDAGRITGFRHKWSFDDMYTAMAIQGLDKDGDGVYSRGELAELAQVNIDGLKEFAYFTYAKLGETALKTKEPVDYWLEHKDGILSLHFTLPLEESVPAEGDGFNFSVYDESFFIAFEFIKEAPVKMSEGAPAGCHANLDIPEKDLKDLQALNDAFGGQATAGDANQGMGFGYAKTVKVGCKRS